MTYDPAAITAHFDQLGAKEWDRFDRTLGDRISLAMHTRALERFIPRGSRVLEIGAGPGRFTELLHRLDCRIIVGDLSAEQLRLNEETAKARGFAESIAGWNRLDICDLSMYGNESFDAVVALGGPLSYVFDERNRALAECMRVVRPNGILLISVMSLWGTMHRHLDAVLLLPAEANRSIVATGDLTKQNDPGSTHHCHMFRSGELRELLDRPGLELLWLSATSALTTGRELAVLPETEAWDVLVEFEELACTDPGYMDAGTHLIAAARRT